MQWGVAPALDEEKEFLAPASNTQGPADRANNASENTNNFFIFFSFREIRNFFN